MYLRLLLFHVFLGICAMAGPACALTEEELAAGHAQRLREFMQTRGERGSLTGGDGVVIRYQRFDRDCNDTAIVILPGWSEPYLKYAEVIYDLTQKHYCVYAMDYRGQGLSSRVADDSQLGHVEDFSHYVRDVRRFHQEVISPAGKRRTYLLAHSMGGLVAALYAGERPQALDGIIMIAPMVAISTGAWPRWLAYSIVSVLDRLGFSDSYVWGHGPWREKPFAENTLTHSEVRYEFGIEWFRSAPSLVLGGVSNRWLKTSLEHGDIALGSAPRLESKILMFEAQEDSFVPAEPLRRFCRLAPRCERVYIEGGKHELLMETDAIRDRVLARIYEFLEE